MEVVELRSDVGRIKAFKRMNDTTGSLENIKVDGGCVFTTCKQDVFFAGKM
jgi:hypothetical protein